ncbi:MAG: lamin tail domain-containing protein, partial [Sedimentisphaerales bacterium]|nr:lamin tail domain-containing protein [Sedimentisphaerales bacterium]
MSILDNFKPFRVCVLFLISILMAECAYSAGLNVDQTDGTTVVAEGLVPDHIYLSLSSAPLADVEVTLNLSSLDLELNGDFPGDSITITFTPANYATPRQVSVVAIQDGIQEGVHSSVISFELVSSDVNYNALVVPAITVTISDHVIDPCSEADISGDCQVTMDDLIILVTQWLNGYECSGQDCGDIINSDGVNILDFSVLAEQWGQSFGPVVINEFMASNKADDPGIDQEAWEVFDENGKAVDWIELYNVSSVPVSLAGWYLTDDADDLAKWEFPAYATIASESYMLIYASGNDTAEGEYIHTNFALGASGEYLALVSPAGVVVHEYSQFDGGFPPQQADVSYGMFGYYTRERYFSPATPLGPNANAVAYSVSDTKFSFKRGFYTEPFYVEITTEESGTEIRYTTDGSTPSVNNGQVYDPSYPIYVNSTTTLRAAAFKNGWEPSNVDTQTYIFVEDVKVQSPAGQVPDGWPSSWAANGHIMDYGMDPEIVNNPAYAELIDDALLAIPTLSIVTDPARLFNSADGVYVHVDNDTRVNGDRYEKQVSLELLDPAGSDGFQIDCGLRLRGGYSRQLTNPKHSFHMYFRSEYGKSKLEFPLFGDEGVAEFDKIDIRTNANFAWHGNWLPHWIAIFNTCVRDEYCRIAQGMMGHPYTRGRYYHLYLNGQYWGLYGTQERIDPRYAASYMSGVKEDFDTIKVDYVGRQVVATDGNLDTYRELYDAVIDGIDPEEYYTLQGLNPDGTPSTVHKRLLDIDNLIDFMLLQYYSCNTDGPGSRWTPTNNFYAVINRVNPDGFKWFAHDNEHTFGVCEANDSRRENMVTPYTTSGANFIYFNPHWLHQQLADQNFEYRLRFADKARERLANGGILTADRVQAVMEQLAEQLDTAIIAESARWGDMVSSTPYTRATWLEALQFTYNFLQGSKTSLTYANLNNYQTWPLEPREERVMDQFRSVNWYPALDAPEFSQHGGYVSEGYALAMTNPDNTGDIYYTTDGADPRDVFASATQTVYLITEDAAKQVIVPSGVLNSQGVLAETFRDIPGFLVEYLLQTPDYPHAPDMVEIWQNYAVPATNRYDNYGTRTRGWLYPPVTGDYTFYLNCDDNGSLLLSTDTDPANATEIAYIYGQNTWGDPGNWSKFSSQKSQVITLQAGNAYYIEALQKDNVGGDFLYVGWEGPGISGPTIITNAYLKTPENIWTLPSYNASGWISGSGAVAYETKPGDEINYSSFVSSGIDVQSQMYGVNSTCYIRIPFVYEQSDMDELKLNVRYDDGFVAYLNGVEILRDNVNETVSLSWNSEALNFRDDAIAMQLTSFDITQYKDLLINGNNVLAIQALNDKPDSSDMLMSVSLVCRQISKGLPAATAVKYESPVVLNNSTEVKARVFTGNSWSALTSATFAIGPVAQSLRVTEIMYNPESANLEFIELQNTGTQAIDINQVKFINGIDHTFGHTIIEPSGFVVLVSDKTAFEAAYIDIPAGTTVLQWASGLLNNAGEKIEYVDAAGSVIQSFSYSNWYDLTDGMGFSLTLVDAGATDLSQWSQKSGWTTSTVKGGTPGVFDNALAANSIVINEVLAHSHATLPDWIELYNNTASAVNISGWYLSDSSTNMLKYQIPDGTVIAPYGFVVFYEDKHFSGIFGLSENGEEVTLCSAVNGIQTGYQVTEDFGASATGVSFGRY